MQWSKCRSCGARVIWTRTAATGKAMPVDVEPSAKGNIVLTDLEDRTPTAVYVDLLNQADYRDAPKYLSHFATCPDAKSWRSK